VASFQTHCVNIAYIPLRVFSLI